MARSFQFRLRALLIGVAVLAVPMAWVGYSLRWVAERQGFLKSHRTTVLSLPLYSLHAPRGLWLFGDWGAFEIYVAGYSLDETEQAVRLFPEARIVEAFSFEDARTRAMNHQDTTQ